MSCWRNRVADIASAWPNDCGDTCGNVFGQALKKCSPDIPANAHVLEIGCAEFGWIRHAKQTWPGMTFTGIDWRRSPQAEYGTIVKDDVMTWNAPQQYDWIVSVSAIEHIGLGHYEHDPTHPDGDVIAMARAFQMLKPGGWMYFDVPWNVGEAYQVHGTSHRIYDDATLISRLVQTDGWDSVWRGTFGQDGKPIPEPQRLGGNGFYYHAMWLRKRN
jgi:hypothetical protein